MENYEVLVNRVCTLREAVQQQKPVSVDWQLGFAAAIRDVLIVLEQENTTNADCAHAETFEVSDGMVNVLRCARCGKNL